MAWDSKSARRRQSSSALPTRVRQQSKQAVQLRSAHVADPFLQDFLSPSFDPAEYWNSCLPPFQVATNTTASAPARQGQNTPIPLAELATQAQATISQLNAHTTRLTNTLTQLTDDMLRSGSRLAYEVELLRGETLGLAEALTDGLRDDIVRFVPGGISDGTDRRAAAVASSSPGAGTTPPPATEPKAGGVATPADEAALPNEPPYITQLRTLTLVRSRLDSVIKTFGDAMEFVFPPSELSVSSSFLSVSAPEPGAEMHSTEEKGQQVLRALRDEVGRLLLASGSDDAVRGVEDAARRTEELKELAQVWKGTAEEKGRARFVDSLAKMVEDRHRDLLRELEQARPGGRQEPDGRSGPPRPNAEGGDGAAADARGYYGGGYGIISQLQKIRGGL